MSGYTIHWTSNLTGISGIGPRFKCVDTAATWLERFAKQYPHVALWLVDESAPETDDDDGPHSRDFPTVGNSVV